MKVGIVGAGTIVPDFLEAAVRIEDITLSGISGLEPDLPVMNMFQNEYGIGEVFTDFQKMLDSDIDTVYIAAPNHLHYMFAKQSLENNKHVILEKPFASSEKEAEELITLAEKKGKIIFEAMSNQYLPTYTETKKVIPELKDIKLVQLNYSQYSRRYDLFKKGTTLPVFDPKKSGGALMDLNVYNIHFIVGLFGAPNKVNYIANIEKDIDTSGILTLEYKDFQAVATAAKDSQAPAYINIQGDGAYLHSNKPANVFNEFFVEDTEGNRKNYKLSEVNNRLYHQLVFFNSLLNKNDLKKARELNNQTLTVMRILDEARKQVGIKIY